MYTSWSQKPRLERDCVVEHVSGTTETMLTCTFKRTPQIGSNVHFAPMDKLVKLVAFQAAGVSSILTGSAIAGEWNGYINHTALITQR